MRIQDPVTGLSKRVSVYGKRRIDVLDEVRALKTRADRGEPLRKTRMLVKELMRRYLDDVAKPKVTEDTFALYETVNRLYIEPTLGALPIATLRTATIEHVLCGSAAEGSLRMRQMALVILNAALETAVRWRLLLLNPAHGIEKPTRVVDDVEDDGETVRPLTPSQVTTLLEAARGVHRFELYAFATFSGARQGEILGLRWEDLDLDNGTARVRGTLNRKTLRVKAPKTRRSRRTIGLTPALCDLLRDFGRRTKTELVFPSKAGTPQSARNVLREFKETLIAAGLAKPFFDENGRRVRGRTEEDSFTFHDLRHTYATLSLLAGVPLKVVSEQLGHSSIQITADTYMHLLPAMRAEASHALDRYFAASKGGTNGGKRAELPPPGNKGAP